MTTEPNMSDDSQDTPENDPVGRLASQWLDAEAGESEFEALPSLECRQLYHAADVQLVHAMLAGLAENSRQAGPGRIHKLMQSIKAEGAQKPRRYIGPAVRWGTAAILLISLTLLIISMPSNKATAAIDRMIEAIENAGDRTYSIVVRDQKTGQRARQTDRFTLERGNRRERAGLDGATLYLRGRNRYVLYRYTPSGQTVINGSDGQTNWLVRPKRDVLVSHNPQAFRIPMPEDLAGLLTLDFIDTLQQIRENYTIKYLGTVPVEPDQEASWTYLHATRQNHTFKGPRVIRIWAHPETGLLRRIEFADIQLQDDPEPKKLIFNLRDQKLLPENWFTPPAHHPEDRLPSTGSGPEAIQ